MQCCVNLWPLRRCLSHVLHKAVSHISSGKWTTEHLANLTVIHGGLWLAGEYWVAAYVGGRVLLSRQLYHDQQLHGLLFLSGFPNPFFPLCRAICDRLLVGFKVLTSGQPAEPPPSYSRFHTRRPQQQSALCCVLQTPGRSCQPTGLNLHKHSVFLSYQFQKIKLLFPNQWLCMHFRFMLMSGLELVV